MILITNSMSKLTAAVIVFTFVACSKSDSNRTTLGVADQEATSQQGDQDNSAFVPADTTGAYLAGSEIACGSFMAASASGVHCRLLKGGRSIYNYVRAASGSTQWWLLIDGKNERMDPPASASLTEGSLWDAVWSRFTVHPWPTITSPSLDVTLKNGMVTRITKTAGKSEDFAASVREPSEGSSSSGSSAGGTSGGSPGSTVGAHTIFITSGKYHSPQDVVATENPTIANCPDLVSTLANTALTGAERASKVSAKICECEARLSSVGAMRAASESATSLLNIEGDIVNFSKRMLATYSKKFVDPVGNLIAAPHELISLQGSSNAPSLIFTTTNAITVDANAIQILFVVNQREPVWAGLVENSLGLLENGEPDCSHWKQDLDGDHFLKARGGTIGPLGASAFTGRSLACGPRGDTARLYCVIP